MKIVKIGRYEVGILNREQVESRKESISKGETIERPDLKLFADTDDNAIRAIELYLRDVSFNSKELALVVEQLIHREYLSDEEYLVAEDFLLRHGIVP